MSVPSTLPDVALETRDEDFAFLHWVGMNRIEVPVLWIAGGKEPSRLAALVSAFVSLDQKPSRGIHMSRLYLGVQNTLTNEPLSFAVLANLCGEFLESHADLSNRSRVAVSLELPVRRKALVSDHWGWRNYPITMTVQKQAGHGRSCQYFLEVRVTYSSTCPASAALSRQIVAESFLQKFPKEASPDAIAEWLRSPEGMAATPHAQRSEARVLVEVNKDVSVLGLIDLIEGVLQTPVQAAVKREDEQEFARRNSQNLMFCEDAARRVRQVLERQFGILDYFGKFEHFESLHPHNAVSFIQKSSQGLHSFE